MHWSYGERCNKPQQTDPEKLRLTSLMHSMNKITEDPLRSWGSKQQSSPRRPVASSHWLLQREATGGTWCMMTCEVTHRTREAPAATCSDVLLDQQHEWICWVCLDVSCVSVPQLEDDIVARPNYFTTMKNFALQQPSEEWMILEFSQLGFIGESLNSSRSDAGGRRFHSYIADVAFVNTVSE